MIRTEIQRTTVPRRRRLLCRLRGCGGGKALYVGVAAKRGLVDVGSTITCENVQVRAHFAGPLASTWASSRTSCDALLGTTRPR